MRDVNDNYDITLWGVLKSLVIAILITLFMFLVAFPTFNYIFKEDIAHIYETQQRGSR